MISSSAPIEAVITWAHWRGVRPVGWEAGDSGVPGEGWPGGPDTAEEPGFMVDFAGAPALMAAARAPWRRGRAPG